MIRTALLFLPFILLLTQCRKEEKQPPVVKQEVNQLPHLAFTTLDGTPTTTRELPGASVLVLFNTDCDHCQRQARAIQEKLSAFSKYTIQFIASDAPEVIQKFAREYQLENQSNVRFGRAEGADVYLNFGSIPTPAIYVYSKEKRLIKSFMGETPVEQIIQSL